MSRLWGEGIRRTLTTREGVHEWREKSSPYVLENMMDPENQIIMLLVTFDVHLVNTTFSKLSFKCGSLVSAI